MEQLENMENIKAVIFDFDGTLYDKKRVALKLILSSPMNMLKMKAERECRRELEGKYFGTGKAYFEAFLKLFSQKTKLSLEKAESWYKSFYLPQIIKILKKNYKAFPETAGIFKLLREKGIKTVVYSDYCCVEQRMNAIGLDTAIADFIFNAEDLGGLKPAVEPFLYIAKELGINAENILVVGDRAATDGKGAEKAKMNFILVQKNRTLATCFSQFLPC